MSGARPVHATDPFSPSQLLVVEDALCEAWRRVLASPLRVRTASEVELNRALVSRLYQLFSDEEVTGFNASAFESPIRGGEVEELRGRQLEKRPDVCFRPAGNPGHSKEFWALFVECKILDADHPMSSYTATGLIRFVDGTYAWAVRRGMMLGYVRDGGDLRYQLERALAKGVKKWSWVPPTATPERSRCCETIHKRRARENIAVRHLALAG
jgi:hypothetical protein